jgi:hypothetical protein
MNQIATTSLPTLQQLGKATAVAIAAAGAILLVAVLPAEYGIDPLGAGSALGLVRQKAAPASGPSATLVKSTQALRSDEMSVTLQPGEGAEVKAEISKGDSFVFSWSADAPVKSDMHGEPHNAGPKEFTTYWKEAQQSTGRGNFTAPFDGIHGWFWRNKGDKPVTVTVKVSGFQKKLYRPS